MLPGQCCAVRVLEQLLQVRLPTFVRNPLNSFAIYLKIITLFQAGTHPLATAAPGTFHSQIFVPHMTRSELALHPFTFQAPDTP